MKIRPNTKKQNKKQKSKNLIIKIKLKKINL